jgi:hypothetical protein
MLLPAFDVVLSHDNAWARCVSTCSGRILGPRWKHERFAGRAEPRGAWAARSGQMRALSGYSDHQIAMQSGDVAASRPRRWTTALPHEGG